MFRVFSSAYLDRQRLHLHKADVARIEALEQQLILDAKGKMLGLPFLREKRLNGKRLLFLVYEKEQAILLVMVTDKKHQQEDIDAIKDQLEELYNYVRYRLGLR